MLLALLLLLASTRPASAQLAQSFYNIVGIDTKTLPNGLQITVRADGAINMGVDFNEFLSNDPTGRVPRAPLSLDSFRLRFVGARSQIPAYTNIGSYPADFVEATLGRDEFTGSGFFYGGPDPSRNNPAIPRVDLRFHFYVPVKVSYFTFIYGSQYGWNFAYSGMQPRDVSVAVAADKRSVIITAISDRVETVRRQGNLTRSPAAAQNHHLTVSGGGTPETPLRLDSLHTPLAQVADEIARTTKLPLIIPAAESAIDVTLYLPAANRDDALRTLALACGLTVQPRPLEEGGGAVLTRGGSPGDGNTSERIPLHFLRPQSARLLLPDFLLPRLHVDSEHNALVVTASPEITARIRADLAVLDRPRPQVRVQAHVYELQRGDADSLGLKATFSGGRPNLDTVAGTVGLNIQTGQLRSYTAALTALIAKSHAHLVAEPYLTIASGETGTLFAGQTRYISVLQTDYSSGGQNVQAIQLPVGTTLTVTPTASTPASDGAPTPVVLDLSASVATVDSVEPKTGLPTVGTRQVSSVVRVRTDGEAVLLGGLHNANDSHTHRHLASGLQRLPLLGHLLDWVTRSHDDDSNQTELIVLVTAEIATDSETNRKDASEGAAKRLMEEKL